MWGSGEERESADAGVKRGREREDKERRRGKRSGMSFGDGEEGRQWRGENRGEREQRGRESDREGALGGSPAPGRENKGVRERKSRCEPEPMGERERDYG